VAIESGLPVERGAAVRAAERAAGEVNPAVLA
jgi:hypothetical protein